MNKSPLVFRKSVNKIVDQRPPPEIKTVPSLMDPIPIFVEAHDKSPEFKLHSLKQLP